MNKNGLYQVKKSGHLSGYWYLYSTKETASTHPTRAPSGGPVGPLRAKYYSNLWSEQLNCNVSYISPNTIFFPIEIDGKYVKIVSGEGVGWMVYPENKDWTKGCIEEVNQ